MTPRRAMAAVFVGAAAVAATAPACKPNLDDTVSIVTAPEVIAARAEPAEVAPGGIVTYTALYVGPSGPIHTGTVDWAFCTERKPLAELEPVSTDCYQTTGSWFVDLGIGSTVSGTVPTDTCSLFGPVVPQPQPGQPPGRPVDPDATGGYYQPLRVLSNGSSGESVDIGETRISCGVSTSSPAIVAEFAQRYHVNANPQISSFGPTNPVKAMWTDDTRPGNEGMTNDLPNSAGVHFDLEVAWPSCPTVDSCNDGVCGPDETPESCADCGPSIVVCPQDCMPLAQCGGAERYVVLDPGSGLLTDQREGISVLWFATAGSFDNDRTGRTAADQSAFSDNGWRAPSHAGTVTMWVVLLDDRGGTTWGEYVLDIH